ETIVHEVMALNAGKGLRESRICKFLDRLGIEEELRRAALPNRPGTRRCDSHALIIAGQTLVISTNHITAFVLRNDFQKFFPNIGEDPAASFLIEPFNLLRPAEKDSAQHEFR